MQTHPIPFVRVLLLVLVAFGSLVACSDTDRGPSTSSSGSSGKPIQSGSASSSSSSGSGGPVSTSSSSGAASKGSTSSSGDPEKTMFPCGPSGAKKQCEEGSEACLIIDGSPFSCVPVTVNNQCNQKACARAATEFGYHCDRTNFPTTTCSYPAGNPCQMTINCD